jgi:filamentous hemagglutinin
MSQHYLDASSCFVAGTLVWTDSGPQPIERLDVGGCVWARSEDGDHASLKPVLASVMRHTRALVELVLGRGSDREKVRMTTSQRVFAKRRGWVEASSLEPGRDVLVDRHGRDVIIADCELLAVEETVYNFEVADFHTYYVGKHAFWAHNPCPPGRPPAT